MCNHHHTPVKINGRSMFYSWLLEMALFLRVETVERERGRRRKGGGDVGREERREREERLSDAGWHGNLAR